MSAQHCDIPECLAGVNSTRSKVPSKLTVPTYLIVGLKCRGTFLYPVHLHTFTLLSLPYIINLDSSVNSSGLFFHCEILAFQLIQILKRV